MTGFISEAQARRQSRQASNTSKSLIADLGLNTGLASSKRGDDESSPRMRKSSLTFGVKKPLFKGLFIGLGYRFSLYDQLSDNNENFGDRSARQQRLEIITGFRVSNYLFQVEYLPLGSHTFSNNLESGESVNYRGLDGVSFSFKAPLGWRGLYWGVGFEILKFSKFRLDGNEEVNSPPLRSRATGAHIGLLF